MKRKNPKIQLHRETLRALDSEILGPVVGGYTQIPRICNPSGRLTCGSCQVTCTTSYC